MVASFPPKPKELEAGRRSHLGGCLSDKVARPLREEPGALKMSAPSGCGAAGASSADSFVVWAE